MSTNTATSSNEFMHEVVFVCQQDYAKNLPTQFPTHLVEGWTQLILGQIHSTQLKYVKKKQKTKKAILLFTLALAGVRALRLPFQLHWNSNRKGTAITESNWTWKCEAHQMHVFESSFFRHYIFAIC